MYKTVYTDSAGKKTVKESENIANIIVEVKKHWPKSDVKNLSKAMNNIMNLQYKEAIRFDKHNIIVMRKN